MRTCEVLVLNFTQSYLARKLQEFLFWVRLPACDSCFRTRGGLAQMVERSLRMRQARGSMPLSSTRATFVAHEHEPPVPGLVSSVGRAHDSYDLRRSHERRRLLRSCGRGFNPRIGCKEFSSWLCGHTTLLFMSQSAEKECPADPGSSPGEGDKQVHCYLRCPS